MLPFVQVGASPHRSAPARWCRSGLFSGDHFEDGDDQLDPAIAADREEGEDFASGSGQDCDNCDGGGIHGILESCESLAVLDKKYQRLSVSTATLRVATAWYGPSHRGWRILK